MHQREVAVPAGMMETEVERLQRMEAEVEEPRGEDWRRRRNQLEHVSRGGGALLRRSNRRRSEGGEAAEDGGGDWRRWRNQLEPSL